jgi:hypothetical protein
VLEGNKYTNLQGVPQIMGHYKVWLAQMWNLEPLITAIASFLLFINARLSTI